MRIEGQILALQEARFRLLTDSGQVYLLTLAHGAPLDASALEDFVEQGTHVAVDFSGEPNLVGGVAHAVHPADRK